MTTIEVLGPGCHNCQLLAEAAKEAVGIAGIEADVVKITDPGLIAGYGVLRTPGLVINGRVVSAGRIPAASDIAQWLLAEEARA
jgi:small redox-active disulfide protein 2